MNSVLEGLLGEVQVRVKHHETDRLDCEIEILRRRFEELTGKTAEDWEAMACEVETRRLYPNPQSPLKAWASWTVTTRGPVVQRSQSYKNRK